MSKCIEYAGANKTKQGYQRVVLNGKAIYVHRLVAMLFHGLYLQDTTTYVCHTCDNTSCINPEHLFLGTAKDNFADCRATENVSYEQLAKDYGISATMVSGIIRRKFWTHI